MAVRQLLKTSEVGLFTCYLCLTDVGKDPQITGSGRLCLSGAGSVVEGPVPPNDASSVRVAVRVRPFVASEERAQAQSCVNTDEEVNSISVGTTRRFTYDFVFGPTSTQEDVYNRCVAELVDAFFIGFNATVFAFGQTSSGKTFTMGSTAVSQEDSGIIPRVIREVFARKSRTAASAKSSVRIQYLEIHNEELRDLLHPDVPTKSIAIRETSDGRIVVAGAADEPVDTQESALRLLELGSLSRSTGSTNMNEHSSRSHAIFTIYLEQQVESPTPAEENADPNMPPTVSFVTAKFHLVDLAGSERAKKTGAAGLRLKESVNINSGLLALGNVISALSSDGKRRPSHVPYRTSKLTRLLQDSLGGNSRTCMVACVTAADTHLEESLNTLKYAQRARYIRNRPYVNQDRRPVSAPEEAIRTQSEEVESNASVLLARPAPRTGSLPAPLDLGKAQRDLVAANQHIHRLQAERVTLQQAVAAATVLQDAIKTAVTELHTHGNIPTSSRDRLLGVLESGKAPDGVAPPRKGDLQAARPPSGRSGHRSAVAGDSEPRNLDLEDLRERIRRLERELAEKTGEAEKFRQLLHEAQEDLSQDEVIFAAKMKELSSAQQEVAQLKKAAAIREVAHAAQLAALRTDRREGAGNGEDNAPIPDVGDDAASDGPYDTPRGVEVVGRQLGDIATEDSDLVLLGDTSPDFPRDMTTEEGTADGDTDQIDGQQAAALRAARASLDVQLRELVFNIRRKEELIVELRANEQRAQSVSQRCLERVREMEATVEEQEAEIRDLRGKLGGLENDRQHSLEEKRQLRTHFQTKIASVTSQLGALQRQLRDRATGQAVERERTRAQARAKQLEEELGAMKSQQDVLHAKIRDVNQKFDRAAAGWAREASDLRKQSIAARQRARTLELELQTCRTQLQRKQEELTALKESSRARASGEVASPSHSRARSLTFRRRTAPDLGGASAVPTRPALDMAWLESTVGKLSRQTEAEDSARELAVKQAALLQQRAQLLQELKPSGGETHSASADSREGSEGGHSLVEDSTTLEALDVQLEIVTAAMQKAQTSMEQAKQAGSELRAQLQGAPVHEANAALELCLRTIGGRAAHNRQAAVKVARLQAALAEKEAALAAAGFTLRMKEMDFERRLTGAAREHAAKTASLLSSMAALQGPGEGNVVNIDDGTASDQGSSARSPQGPQGPSQQQPSPLEGGNAHATSHFTIPAHRTSASANDGSDTGVPHRSSPPCERKGAFRIARSKLEPVAKENIVYDDEDAGWLHFQVR